MTLALRLGGFAAKSKRRALPNAGASAPRRHPPMRAHRPHRVQPGAARKNTTWETQSFGAASAAILTAFVLALVYLGSSTGVATAGYEAQRLAAQRDELRRQSALLDVELASLASPARIEAEAQRLGLVHLSYVPVVPADPIAASR